MIKPEAQKTSFGTITLDGQDYTYDVLIRLDGEVTKRKKKLSKQVYGTSHKISEEEARYIYEPGAKQVVIGTGQYGLVEPSGEARQFFESHNLEVRLAATPQALELWNASPEGTIGLFHVTC
ncbi:MAG: MTH938/NDUFAF3 family protein [Anaerolineales bacterium]|nr:MTH938/NDUFAF3 family protein [Anaerolineales bacterium]